MRRRLVFMLAGVLLAGVLLAGVLLAGVAFAREADGRLGLLLRPHDGAPALVARRGAFSALLSARAELFLVDEAGEALSLELKWGKKDRGRYRVSCKVPEAAGPGRYALEARTGEARDRTAQSVFVADSFAAAYRFACVRGPGADGLAAFTKRLSFAASQETAFVVVSGGLTPDGSAASYQALLAALAKCPLPAFVCGEGGKGFASFFGEAAYLFRYGEDGYIVFEGSGAGDGAGGAAGYLQVHRRAVKASRWSVGLAAGLGRGFSARAGLVLFVDNPLDYLWAGRWTPENAGPDRVLPWGTTRFLSGTGSGMPGVEIVSVDASGVMVAPE